MRWFKNTDKTSKQNQQKKSTMKDEKPKPYPTKQAFTWGGSYKEKRSTSTITDTKNYNNAEPRFRPQVKRNLLRLHSGPSRKPNRQNVRRTPQRNANQQQKMRMRNLKSPNVYRAQIMKEEKVGRFTNPPRKNNFPPPAYRRNIGSPSLNASLPDLASLRELSIPPSPACSTESWETLACNTLQAKSKQQLIQFQEISTGFR